MFIIWSFKEAFTSRAPRCVRKKCFQLFACFYDENKKLSHSHNSSLLLVFLPSKLISFFCSRSQPLSYCKRLSSVVKYRKLPRRKNLERSLFSNVLWFMNFCHAIRLCSPLISSLDKKTFSYLTFVKTTSQDLHYFQTERGEIISLLQGKL